MHKFFTQAALTGAIVFGAFACSHAPDAQQFPESASPQAEVSRLSVDMDAAVAQQVDVLSPDNFRKAFDSWHTAKEKLDRQKSPKDTLDAVADSRAYLTKANAVAQVARNTMEDVVAARQASRVAGVQSYYPTEFSKLDEDFRDVTNRIEKNKMKGIEKSRGELQARYLELELLSIKQANLREAKSAVDSAKSVGAKKYAPQTLAAAEKSIMDTDAFINANRHNKAQIQERANVTLASANHLLKITQDAKAGVKVSPEEMALQFEREQAKVVAKQREVLAKQAEVAASQQEIRRKQMELKGTETELQAEKAASSALVSANNSLSSDLASQQALDEKYKNAQKTFSKDEAEVYKQGDAIVIRLRGMEFPKAQAMLKGDNFPLLAKVQEVIKDFGKSSVVVEGHTDSQGGKAVNEKLSQERADAVQKYLSAADLDTEIKAVGMGYQKPLATNKTPAGRAQNRRVDIVISPEGIGNL